MHIQYQQYIIFLRKILILVSYYYIAFVHNIVFSCFIWLITGMTKYLYISYNKCTIIYNTFYIYFRPVAFVFVLHSYAKTVNTIYCVPTWMSIYCIDAWFTRSRPWYDLQQIWNFVFIRSYIYTQNTTIKYWCI